MEAEFVVGARRGECMVRHAQRQCQVFFQEIQIPQGTTDADPGDAQELIFFLPNSIQEASYGDVQKLRQVWDRVGGAGFHQS